MSVPITRSIMRSAIKITQTEDICLGTEAFTSSGYGPENIDFSLPSEREYTGIGDYVYSGLIPTIETATPTIINMSAGIAFIRGKIVEMNAVVLDLEDLHQPGGTDHITLPGYEATNDYYIDLHVSDGATSVGNYVVEMNEPGELDPNDESTVELISSNNCIRLFAYSIENTATSGTNVYVVSIPPAMGFHTMRTSRSALYHDADYAIVQLKQSDLLIREDGKPIYDGISAYTGIAISAEDPDNPPVLRFTGRATSSTGLIMPPLVNVVLSSPSSQLQSNPVTLNLEVSYWKSSKNRCVNARNFIY